jgi:hypothetical protein
MSSVALVPRNDEPAPRAKRLPLKLLAGGAEPRLPLALVYRKGARELLLQSPWAIRSLVMDAFERIPRYFGDTARFALERFVDPEEAAEEPLLYLVVGTTLSASEARDALDRFDEEWWLDNVDRGQNRIHLSLEFL